MGAIEDGPIEDEWHEFDCTLDPLRSGWEGLLDPEGRNTLVADIEAAARDLALAVHIGEDMENGCPDCAVGNPCKDRERIEKLGDG